MTSFVLIALTLGASEPERTGASPSTPPPAVQVAVESLAVALTDEDAEVRRRAAIALSALAPYAKPAVPALIQSLKDESVRFKALDTLAEIGADAKAAVPRLLEHLGEPYFGERARRTVEKLAIDESSVPELMRLLDNGNDLAKENAAILLGHCGSAAEPAIPALMALLHEQRPLGPAAQGLGGIGTAALPFLRDAFEKERDHAARNRLAGGLYAIWWRLPEPRPTFRDWLPEIQEQRAQDKEEEEETERKNGTDPISTN